MAMRQKVIEQLHAGVAASPEWMAQPEPIRIEIIHLEIIHIEIINRDINQQKILHIKIENK